MRAVNLLLILLHFDRLLARFVVACAAVIRSLASLQQLLFLGCVMLA